MFCFTVKGLVTIFTFLCRFAVTPLTPLANLKVLIAAASTALEQECASGGRGGDGVDEGGTGDDGGGRKMKSLSVLCQRYAVIHCQYSVCGLS